MENKDSYTNEEIVNMFLAYKDFLNQEDLVQHYFDKEELTFDEKIQHKNAKGELERKNEVLKEKLPKNLCTLLKIE